MRVNTLPSSRTLRRGTLLIVALVAVVVVLLSAQGTAAHARLRDANPKPGAALASAPDTIRLMFTEPIDAKFSSASLVNAGDQAVPIGSVQVDPADDHVAIISVVDPAAVQPGNYTLVWRALSAADGHATDGVLSFSVGTGQAPTVASTGQAREAVPWWEVSASWLELVGFVAVGGLFWFALLVLIPALHADPELIERLCRPLRAVWWGSWLLALLALLAVLMTQAGRVNDSSVYGWPGVNTLQAILTETRFGQCWLIRIALLIALGSLAFLTFGFPRFREHIPTAAKWPWLAGSAVSAATFLTIPLSGHAAAVDPRWAGIAIDWLHVLSVTIWLGGLVYLVVALAELVRSKLDEDAASGAAMARRFSFVALLAAAIIVGSGFVNAAFHVSGPRNLTSDTYGPALIVKHLLIIPILIAAAVNFLVTVPRLKQSTADENLVATKFFLRALWFTAAAELGLAVAVLVAAAALSDLAPADEPLEVDVAAKVVSYDQHAQAGNVDVWLLGRIAGEAGDRFTLSLTDQSGNAPTTMLRVIVRTTAAEATGSISDRFDAEPLAGNPGVYVFSATRIGLAANWTLETTVRRAGLPDQTARFAIDTHGTGVQPPRLVSDHWRMPRMTAIAWLTFTLAIIVGIAGIVGVRKLPELEPFAAALLLTMIALIVTGFLATSYRLSIPISASTNVPNPMAADEGSIQRGQKTYEALCLACHGAAGSGTDAQTAAKDPHHQHATSTDLMSRKIKQQRDGDLYDGIANGVPGTDMPAFDTALSEQERWDLVNYLRKLQHDAE